MISNGLHGRSWDSGLGQSLLAGAIGGGIAGGLGYVGSSIKGMEAFARSTTYGAMKGVATHLAQVFRMRESKRETCAPVSLKPICKKAFHQRN
ncbi:MAG: hypothetical protein KA713_03430 [Chryseotalea sp. WA131a]|jgi:hypothetical protein|nr:MAG: hypothetical protein KA713_03430 [Chryseotalea sp. WA131a]